MAEPTKEPEQENTTKPCKATCNCPKGGEHATTGSEDANSTQQEPTCTECNPDNTDSEESTDMLKALFGDPEKAHTIHKYTTCFTVSLSLLMLALAVGIGFAQFYLRQGVTDYAEILPRTIMMVGWWFGIPAVGGILITLTSNMSVPILTRLKSIVKAFVYVIIPMFALGTIGGTLLGTTLDDKAAALISDTSLAWSFILGITVIISQLLNSQFLLKLAGNLLTIDYTNTTTK